MMPRSKRQQHQLKSMESPTPRAFAVFRNQSTRVADILWLNWTGDRVNYTSDGLKQGSQMLMNTYKGHPWIFRDHVTGDKLVFTTGADRRPREVFFPVPADEDRVVPTHVNIQLPVYTLRERSLQVVRTLTKKSDFDRLELPRMLISQLAHPDDTVETED